MQMVAYIREENYILLWITMMRTEIASTLNNKAHLFPSIYAIIWNLGFLLFITDQNGEWKEEEMQILMMDSDQELRRRKQCFCESELYALIKSLGKSKRKAKHCLMESTGITSYKQTICVCKDDRR